jgi:hypothetical protein
VPATEIEQFVLDQVGVLGPDRLRQAGVSSILNGINPATASDSEFDRLLKTLSMQDQARIVQALIERIDYNGREQAISLVFRSATPEPETDTP